MVTLVIIPIGHNDRSYLAVDDLMRMYLRWAERNGYPFVLTKYPTSQAAGQSMPHDLNVAPFIGSAWEVLHIDAPLVALEKETGVHVFRQRSLYNTDPKIEHGSAVVTVTGAKETATKPIRLYDLVEGFAQDHRTKEKAEVMRVLNGEYLLDGSAALEEKSHV